MIFIGRMVLLPCNRRDKLNRNCRLGYIVVGWALGLCNKWCKFDRIFMVGYIFVGRPFCSYNRWDKFDNIGSF